MIWGWRVGASSFSCVAQRQGQGRATALLRLSLELSGIHPGMWKGPRCFPGFPSVRMAGVLRESTRSLFNLWVSMYKCPKDIPTPKSLRWGNVHAEEPLSHHTTALGTQSTGTQPHWATFPPRAVGGHKSILLRLFLDCRWKRSSQGFPLPCLTRWLSAF